MVRYSPLVKLFLIVGLLSARAGFALETWNVDDTHSTARFKVRHMMVSNVSGEITGMKGTFSVDDANPSNLKIDVALDAHSITTMNAKRDEHLKGADFFDVKKFPKITFKTKKVESEGANKLRLTGDLTLHGVTKEVTFESEGLTPAVKDPWGNLRRGFVATTKLNRKDFGVSWNKSLDGGGLVVGEDVDVTVECEVTAAKKAEKKG